MTMRAVITGATLAFAGHTMADTEGHVLSYLMDAHIEKAMGKAFMPAVTTPQRAGHISVHPGSAVALADRAPVASFPLSNRVKSVADLDETNYRMKSELETVRSRMAIMARPHVQNRTTPIFGFGCLGYFIGATFLFYSIYKFFVKGNGHALAMSINPLDGAGSQASTATALPLILSSLGILTAGNVIRRGGGFVEATCDPEPTQASYRSEDVKTSISESRTGRVVPIAFTRPDSSIRKSLHNWSFASSSQEQEQVILSTSRATCPAMLADLGETGEARQRLFQDMKIMENKRAEMERELMEPNMQEIQLPTKRKRKHTGSKGKAASRSGGGGFGAGAAAQKPKLSPQTDLRLSALEEDGVVLVPGVLSKETAEELCACIADELRRAYAAVENDSLDCLGRFNVPQATFDKLRGYLLLPLRDECSVEAGEAKGPLVKALNELLQPGAPLADLFSEACDGGKSELYDVVALRTEAGSARQPIHSDTPYQKVPGLFCAFIAVHDVRYEQGSTVFIPGTHKQNEQRTNFDNIRDGSRDTMLASAQSRYSMLKAGDAVFFNMSTLHAGMANFPVEDGGGQRFLFILTFRNLKAKQPLGHAPNLRPGYRNRGITLDAMQKELANAAPFAGVFAGDGRDFGDGLQAEHPSLARANGMLQEIV